MENLDDTKLKDTDYLEEYINIATYRSNEIPVTIVIKNLLEQIYDLNMENINSIRNNNKKKPYGNDQKNNSEIIQFKSLYNSFASLKLEKNNVFKILDKFKKSFINLYSNDPKNCKICILNIVVLVLEFRKSQLDEIANVEGGPSSDVDFLAAPDISSPDLSGEKETPPKTNLPSKSNSDGDPKSRAPSSGGDADPKPPKDKKKETGLNEDSVDHFNVPNEGSLRLEQIVFRSIVLFLLIVIFGFELYDSNNFKSIVRKNSDNITNQIGQIYTPPIENAKDYGYLKTQFDKLIKPELSLLKLTDPSLPQKTDPIPLVGTELKKGNISFDEIAPNLKTNLDYLDKKIEALNKINEKVEIKLDGEVLKKIFDSVVKDENSDFGKMIKKINATGDKKPVDTVDTTSAKDKKELASLKSENDKLNKSIGERDKEISKEKASVTILNGEVDKKNKEIDKLETKLKSIGDEKTGFKGPSGHFAILLTNSKDFELTEPILSATLVAVEKQNKENKGVQKVGIYAATGNSIDVKFSLKKGTRGLKPTEMDVANARPTETIAEVGKTFLEFAFDDGKDPIIPIDDRKAIIIATWSAGAPKDGDGWDKISQVDAILIQTPKANQLREGSAWLDFILKKNGRLLFIQAEEKITGSSPSIGQLQKHLSTLLNTKKD